MVRRRKRTVGGPELPAGVVSRTRNCCIDGIWDNIIQRQRERKRKTSFGPQVKSQRYKEDLGLQENDNGETLQAASLLLFCSHLFSFEPFCPYFLILCILISAWSSFHRDGRSGRDTVFHSALTATCILSKSLSLSLPNHTIASHSFSCRLNRNQIVIHHDQKISPLGSGVSATFLR